MSDLTVSTVIPAYRAARTIGRAVDSVLAQTRPPVEILVVDDGSPDDLAAAVQRFGDRVTLLRKPNGGAASARNCGIEPARGDLIAFLDADDYWEPHKLERQLEVFARHPEVGLVAGRFFEERPGGPTRRVVGRARRDYDRPLTLAGEQAFTTATQVWTGTVIVRRSVLGHRRFLPGLEPAEDRDLWVRLVGSCPVYLISEPLATAVLEPGSLSRSNVDRDYGNMLRVVHRHRDLLGRSAFRQWERTVYRKWAAGHLANGQPDAALAPAWSRVRRGPLSAEGWWVYLKALALARGRRRVPGDTTLPSTNGQAGNGRVTVPRA
jgi:glycosyltransferase involved in cell wall biosynthesis